MKTDENCVFCKIVSGEFPSYKIYEDDLHLGFLSISPNTEAFSVVVTKSHHDSYVFNNDINVISGLMEAAKSTAKKIDNAYEDVGRTALIFEGFGVNHLHCKLFPMHGTSDDEWKKRTVKVNKYFDNYEGYVSSHDYDKADDEKLKQVADKINNL